MQSRLANFYARVTCQTAVIYASIAIMKKAALSLAIQSAGGPRVVGDYFGISRQAVEQWPECPPLRVIGLEKLSGVSRHVLRPDIYGPQGEQARAS